MREQLFPMLEGPPLPWPVAEAVWRYLYAADGHGDQSLKRIAERGGFGYDEIRILAEHLQKRRDAGRMIHVVEAAPEITEVMVGILVRELYAIGFKTTYQKARAALRAALAD